jgi:hypothetical protein
VIDVANVFTMIKKMGIDINLDEARVLVASASTNSKSVFYIYFKVINPPWPKPTPS